jgi:hypothetical protein
MFQNGKHMTSVAATLSLWHAQPPLSFLDSTPSRQLTVLTQRTLKPTSFISGNPDFNCGNIHFLSSLFWNITPCSPLKINRRFGGICRLHLLKNKPNKEPVWSRRRSNPTLFCLLFNDAITRLGPPLWSSGHSFWLQIQRSRVRFPALPDILRSRGSGTGSTQPREENWGATWMKK